MRQRDRQTEVAHLLFRSPVRMNSMRPALICSKDSAHLLPVSRPSQTGTVGTKLLLYRSLGVNLNWIQTIVHMNSQIFTLKIYTRALAK